MTSNDQTSDQFLTEEVYRPRQSEGNCPACQFVPCRFAHLPDQNGSMDRNGFVPFCRCDECRAEKVSQRGPSAASRMDDQAKQVHDQLLAKWQAQALHRQNRENAQSQLGPREFTLTYSPSWFADDDEAQRTMRQAIDRLTAYYTHEIIEFHAVGEFGADGRSHVHGWYHLAGGRKITDKNFRRAYPRWNPKRKLGKGFEGGHHETIQRVSDFAGYAEKHLDEAWLKVDINNADDTPRS